jgi:hypothetical protein
LNKGDIEKYLRMVGQELDKQGLTLEILLLGGAVMLIEVGNRNNTEDVDTYYLPDFVAITKAAAVVAEREALNDSWLNSAAAGFTYFFTRQPDRKLWRKFPGLHVYTASLEYIFVMKIMAGRSKDSRDIMALARKLGILKRQDVIALLRQYVPEESLTPDMLYEIRRRFRS